MQKVQLVFSKLQQRLRPVIEGLLVAGILYIGFVCGKTFPGLFHRQQATLIITQATTHSVSVTDRGELIILDRNTGAIQMFAPEIGENVFRAYANRMVQPNLK